MNQPNPFELLGVPVRFGLETSELERAHRALSKALHPDLHRQKPAGERRMLLERAMQVNAAYRLLRDPVTRARALLSLRGLSDDEALEASPPPAFLMGIMEERELLSDARAARNKAQIGALIRSVSARNQELLGELTRAFDEGVANDSLLPLLAQLRYDARFLEEAKNAADDLDEAGLSSTH